MELAELAERAEQASGPDRELDEAIYSALVTVHGTGRLVWHEFLGNPRVTDQAAPHFTASFDAAMTLKPNGLGIYLRHSLRDGERLTAEVHLTRTVSQVLGVNASYSGEQDFAEGHAATPALALTAACLRARATLPTKDD